MANEVVKKGAAAVPGIFADNEYTGLENVGIKNLKQAYLTIAKETVLDENDKVKIKGGDFVHSVTKEAFGNTLKVVVLKTDPGIYVEYKGKDNGGDWVARHGRELPEGAYTTDGFRYKVNRDVAVNDLKETDYYFVMLPERPELGIMILSLKSTGIKHSKDWLSKMWGIVRPDNASRIAPSYYTVWEIKTGSNINNAGQPYYTLGVGKVSFINRVPGWTWELYPDFTERLSESLELVKTLDTKNIADHNESFPDEEAAPL